jgi:hypothetical protein
MLVRRKQETRTKQDLSVARTPIRSSRLGPIVIWHGSRSSYPSAEPSCGRPRPTLSRVSPGRLPGVDAHPGSFDTIARSCSRPSPCLGVQRLALRLVVAAWPKASGARTDGSRGRDTFSRAASVALAAHQLSGPSRSSTGDNPRRQAGDPCHAYVVLSRFGETRLTAPVGWTLGG